MFVFQAALTEAEKINIQRNFYKGVSRFEMTLSRVNRKARSRGLTFAASCDLSRADFQRFSDRLRFDSTDMLAVRARLRNEGKPLTKAMVGPGWIS